MPKGVAEYPTRRKREDRRFEFLLSGALKRRLAEHAIATDRTAAEVLRDFISQLPEYAEGE